MGRFSPLDPDKKGAVVWKVHAVDIPKGQEHSFYANLNGVVWGGAADDQNVYYGLQSGGMVALKLATGDVAWRANFPKAGGRSRYQFGRRNGHARVLCSLPDRTGSCMRFQRPMATFSGNTTRHGNSKP